MSLLSLIPQPYALYAKLGLGAAALAGAFYAGHHMEANVYKAHLAKDALRTARIEAATQKISTAGATLALQASQQREVEVTKVQTITKTLQEKVPYYVQSNSVDSAGSVGGLHGASLPLGFVWLHNAAARGDDTLLSAAPGDPALAAPSGVDLPALASTVTDNYGLLHQCQATVRSWRGWYDAQAALWNKAPEK